MAQADTPALSSSKDSSMHSMNRSGSGMISRHEVTPMVIPPQ